jgi:hypothetical protein
MMMREDMVGRDEFFFQLGQVGHASSIIVGLVILAQRAWRPLSFCLQPLVRQFHAGASFFHSAAFDRRPDRKRAAPVA